MSISSIASEIVISIPGRCAMHLKQLYVIIIKFNSY
jgi:hypothetical protein